MKTKPTMPPLLSILIPSLVNREKQLDELLLALHTQIQLLELPLLHVNKGTLPENKSSFIKCYDYSKIHVVVFSDNKERSVGVKRNSLVNIAQGQYLCHIDDDDLPGNNYIPGIIKAIETHQPDACSLRGVITTDGQTPEIFEHSTKYPAWRTVNNAEIKYERYINHLNAIKTDIARQVKFLDVSHGEDRDYSDRLMRSGLIKNEAVIPGIIYHYRYKTQK